MAVGISESRRLVWRTCGRGHDGERGTFADSWDLKCQNRDTRYRHSRQQRHNQPSLPKSRSWWRCGMLRSMGRMCYKRTDSMPHTWDDVNGHGSRCLEIAIAEENDYGIVGMCPSCKGVVEKNAHTMNQDEDQDVIIISPVILGIQNAWLHGARVLNLSYFTRASLSQGIVSAVVAGGTTYGMLFTFSCGNDNYYNNENECNFPPLGRFSRVCDCCCWHKSV